MRYIGSKSATLTSLARLVRRYAPDATSICDPFAGMCTVAKHFKAKGFDVVTGDILGLSHVFQIAVLRHDRTPTFAKLAKSGSICLLHGETSSIAVFRHLNSLKPRRGYCFRTFSVGGAQKRKFFSVTNACRIDAVRAEIESWRSRKLISSRDEAFLLASLIDAADRVANTAGTYYAHLKKLTRKARKRLELVPMQVVDRGSATCFRGDARDVVAKRSTDILYLDPPYNERDYASYYHLPETLVRNDAPKARGKSGISAVARVRSDFCRPAAAEDALREIIRRSRSRHVVVHYTPEGLVSDRAIRDALGAIGTVSVHNIRVRAYATDASAAREAMHRVYWCLVRDPPTRGRAR